MKIQGLSENSRIENFCIENKVNTHGRCNFRVQLADEDEEFFTEKAGEILVVEAEGSVLFSGILEEVQIEEVGYELSVEVVLYTPSILWDKECHAKLFQNMNYSEIVSEISRDKKEKVEFTSTEQGIIIQFGQTDFEFLCRIADVCKKGVWVQNDKIIVAENIGVTQTLNKCDIKSSKRQITSHGENIFFEVTHQIPIGCSIKYNSKEFLVIENKSVTEQHGDKHYIVATSNSFTGDEISKKLIMNCSAMVVDNNDPDNLERLQLAFEEEHLFEVEVNNRMWCSVLVPYVSEKGGISFLPEIEDTVQVEIYEDDIIVVGIIRSSKAPFEQKYISDQFGNHIIWSENDIKLQCGDNTIKLANNEIELVSTATNIRLNDSELELIRGNSTIILDDSKIKLVFGSSSIKLDSSGVNIQGSKIKLN